MTRCGSKVMLAAVVCVGLACAVAPSKFSLREVNVAAPSLMIAHKSPRTAYLVLDPAKVPNVLPVLVDNQDRGGRLEDVQAFVTRDLAKVFGNYFQKVEVVAPGQPIPQDDSAAVVDVKIDRVEVRVMQTSQGVSSGYAALTWGLGLRLSEGNDYLYSFAGESHSTPTSDVSVAFRSMFEAAITDMLAGYTDKKVHEAVLAASPGSRPTAIPASGSGTTKL